MGTIVRAAAVLSAGAAASAGAAGAALCAGAAVSAGRSALAGTAAGAAASTPSAGAEGEGAGESMGCVRCHFGTHRGLRSVRRAATRTVIGCGACCRCAIRSIGLCSIGFTAKAADTEPVVSNTPTARSVATRIEIFTSWLPALNTRQHSALPARIARHGCIAQRCGETVAVSCS